MKRIIYIRRCKECSFYDPVKIYCCKLKSDEVYIECSHDYVFKYLCPLQAAKEKSRR